MARSSLTSLAVILALGAVTMEARGVLLVSEPFTYPNGNLVGNTPLPGPGGTWQAHSSAGSGPIQVTGGAAVVQQATGFGEDANIPMAGAAGPGVTLYAGFDVTVSGTVTSSIYFAHYKTPNTNFFNSRLYVAAPTVSGFRFGLTNGTTASNAVLSGDLLIGTTYRVVVSYNYDLMQGKFWINPVDESSASFTATDSGFQNLAAEFALRQNGSGSSTQTVDNLCVATNFMEALTCAPSLILAGTGTATPASVPQGGSTLLTVSVTGGVAPYTVTGNLGPIGGNAAQPFFDDGTNGDVTAGDKTFSYLATVPCAQGLGPVAVTTTLSDSGPDPDVNPIINMTITDGTLILGRPSPGGAAPADDGQPANATRCAGETASFSTATSGGGVTYQWFNGANNPITDGPTGTGSTISGATTSRMTITNVSAADAGAGPYKCTLTRACDATSVTTNAATLTIGTGATAAQKQIVISRVYGGGGNSGAAFTHDYIELFNKGTTGVNVNGWSVQHASASGDQAPFDRPARITVLPNVTIAPGKYLLIQESQGTGGNTPLPTPDVIGSIALGSTNGKVALVNHSDPLSETCPYGDGAAPSGCSIVDFVGYGTGVCAEGGSPAPGTVNTNAVVRTIDCTDTDNNGNDFVLLTQSDGATIPTAFNPPRNSSTPAAPTVVISPPATIYSCTGLTATMSVTAAGPCLSYQWQVNQAPALAGFVNVTTGTGGTTPTYTTGTLAAGDQGNQYRVIVTNGFGPQATSGIATVDLSGASVADKQIVIAAVYGGAGCTTAGCSLYTHDYIQLFNRGATTVSLSGWSVQYASAAGSTWSSTNLSGTLLPGRYYLIQLAGNANGLNPLPTPDAIGTSSMSATSGKVALIKSAETIGAIANPISDCRMVDFVGYGGANAFEGANPAPGPADNSSAVTRSPVCSDTDQNGVDFVSQTAAPQAQGSAVAADLNNDGRVDAGVPGAGNDDLDIFMACQTRDGVPYDPNNLPAGCTVSKNCNNRIRTDYDGDGDVDLRDYAVQQRCYNGSSPQTNPNCGD